MARAGGEKTRELEGVRHEAAGCLSRAHVAALVAHPDALRSALAVAADVLTPDDAERTALELSEAMNPGGLMRKAAGRLAARTRESAAETLPTSDELAERVGLKTRQSRCMTG